MTVPPTVDQFPTFAETLSWLTKKACKCIWYLPDKKRCCFVRITDEVNQSALHLAEGISKAGTLTKTAYQVLADIAEQSCCARHHRNKMWGSGMAQELAARWQNEIQVTLSVANCKITQIVKVESVSPSISTISECSTKLNHHSVDLISDAQISIAGLSDSKSLPTDQAALTTHSLPPHKPVAFAKHEVWKGETLLSKLLSPIDPQAGRVGSLYIFTHTKDAFCGMIKIGYTCRTIDFRLSSWAECGHGHPVLLDSYVGIRHPERVELLTHFELLEYWYAQRWCNFHRQAHIEWFKIDIGTASSIARLWSLWMERANPYDRRGYLNAFWKESIDFLTMHEVPITAKVMMQIQELEEGSPELVDFIDDNALRKRQEPVVKQEQFETSQVVVCLPQCTKAGHAAEGDLEVKSSLVKIEVKELLSSSTMVTTTDVVTTKDGTPKLEVAGECNPSTCLPQEEVHTQTAIASSFAAHSC
jgi:T5orf172 domain